MMHKGQSYPEVKYELRFYTTEYRYEVIDSFYDKSLAYGMRKKLNRENPLTYPLGNLRVRKSGDSNPITFYKTKSFKRRGKEYRLRICKNCRKKEHTKYRPFFADENLCIICKNKRRDKNKKERQQKLDLKDE